MGRVVTSGNNQLGIWEVQTTSPNVALSNVSNAYINTGQLPGFFTSVSSNGGKDAVVWALSRPYASPWPIYLMAYDPAAARGGNLPQIFSAKAGLWPNTGGDSNQVPMVANGRVYVASNKELDIFGLK